MLTSDLTLNAHLTLATHVVALCVDHHCTKLSPTKARQLQRSHTKTSNRRIFTYIIMLLSPLPVFYTMQTRSVFILMAGKKRMQRRQANNQMTEENSRLEEGGRVTFSLTFRVSPSGFSLPKQSLVFVIALKVKSDVYRKCRHELFVH